MLVGKREYNLKLVRVLEANQKLLIERFQKEWGQAQKKEERQKIINTIKKSSKIIGRILLGFLIFGGVLTVALVAPKIFVIFDTRGRRIYLREEDFRKIKYNFRRQKYVEFLKKDENSFEIFITEKGKKRSLGEIFNNLKLDKTKKWDSKWRIVMFDIPNKHKWERDGFRIKLQQLGFYQLQKSVFVSPYPCEEEVDFLIKVFSISPFVHLFVSSNLDNDSDLKKYFQIK